MNRFISGFNVLFTTFQCQDTFLLSVNLFLPARSHPSAVAQPVSPPNTTWFTSCLSIGHPTQAEEPGPFNYGFSDIYGSLAECLRNQNEVRNSSAAGKGPSRMDLLCIRSSSDEIDTPCGELLLITWTF